MNKAEIKRELARLKEFGLTQGERVNYEAVINMVKRLERQRCNTALAVKIAEYEQKIAWAAWEAEQTYCDYYSGVEANELRELVIDGIVVCETQLPDATFEAIVNCELEVREALAAFDTAMTSAYEHLAVLWIDSEVKEADVVAA